MFKVIPFQTRHGSHLGFRGSLQLIPQQIRREVDRFGLGQLNLGHSSAQTVSQRILQEAHQFAGRILVGQFAQRHGIGLGLGERFLAGLASFHRRMTRHTTHGVVQHPTLLGTLRIRAQPSGRTGRLQGNQILGQRLHHLGPLGVRQIRQHMGHGGAGFGGARIRQPSAQPLGSEAETIRSQDGRRSRIKTLADRLWSDMAGDAIEFAQKDLSLRDVGRPGGRQRDGRPDGGYNQDSGQKSDPTPPRRAAKTGARNRIRTTHSRTLFRPPFHRPAECGKSPPMECGSQACGATAFPFSPAWERWRLAGQYLKRA